MFKNHFKVARRNLRRHPLVASLNIAGLACFAVIALYVRDELSYDRCIIR